MSIRTVSYWIALASLLAALLFALFAKQSASELLGIITFVFFAIGIVADVLSKIT